MDESDCDLCEPSIPAGRAAEEDDLAEALAGIGDASEFLTFREDSQMWLRSRLLMPSS